VPAPPSHTLSPTRPLAPLPPPKNPHHHTIHTRDRQPASSAPALPPHPLSPPAVQNMDDAAWTQAPDTLVHMADGLDGLEDLGTLFDFGDMDLNPPTTPGVPADFGGAAVSSYPVSSTTQYLDGPPPYTTASAAATFPAAAAYLQQQQHQHQHQQQQQHFIPAFVPPTPTSFDMHGEVPSFLSQLQQHGLLNQQQQPHFPPARKDDAALAFTPMASPANTPQYHFQPEFTVPGAYFSPLSSPMIHAQHQQRAMFYTGTAPNSTATSPVDPNVDVEMPIYDQQITASGFRRPTKKKKPATPRSVMCGTTTKSRPAPKRKSSTMLASLVSTSAAPVSSEDDGAGSASLSPEENPPPLPPPSQLSMGPPPRPPTNGSSRTHSPAIHAQGPAATPKSLLLSRPPSQQRHNLDEQPPPTPSERSHETGMLDELLLPESADTRSQRPSLAPINTTVSEAEETPQVGEARKTPKLGPQSTPASAGGAMTPGTLLVGGTTKRGGGGRKKVGGGPRPPPRISPSIKPLLPEGGTSPPHRIPFL